MLLDTYCLREYGARVGDSLLAYIGLAPEIQGSRLHRVNDSIFQCATRFPIPTRNVGLHSLADLMFSTWLELPAIESAPFTFIRTRLVMSSIRHLANKHGFAFCGSFNLNFRGQRQERLVFKRQNYKGSHFTATEKPTLGMRRA
jgi:hypothetical protein